MNDNRLSRTRRLSFVPRWIVTPMIRRQNVAEHSYHVCMIVLWLAPFLLVIRNGAVTETQLMKAALFHDEMEALTGDIASPAKKWFKTEEVEKHEQKLGIGEFETETIRPILKLADLIEAILFVVEERAMGNGSLAAVTNDIHYKLQSVIDQIAWADPSVPMDHLGDGYYSAPPEAAALVQRISDIVALSKHPTMEQS